MNRRRGIGVSPGIAIGKALVFEGRRLAVIRLRIRDEAVEAEVERLRTAVARARRQIEELMGRLSAKGSLKQETEQILDAHLLMLADDELVGAAERKIRADRVNAEWALAEVLDWIRLKMRGSEEELFRDRVRDVEGVVAQVQDALSGIEGGLPAVDEEYILVAHDPTPGEAAQLDRRYIRGIALDAGGRTSHTGIIAKSLEIPAVVGLGDITRRVRTGDLLILDGDEGEVLLEPSRTLVREYLNKKRAHEIHERELLQNRDLPAVTADGHKVFLQANVDFPYEVDSAVRFGAEGIGLFRSEFLFLDAERRGLPGEDEQYEVYRTLAERVHPQSAIVRTIDFGGGKVTPFGETVAEGNPIMGLRAIRYCLKHRDVFRTQLRALLRASAHGRLKIMFPMVTSVSELRLAKAILDEARVQLRAEGRPFNEKLSLGIMIEVPAAAAISDLLAREVEFFSIGTNDFIQFFLAIDRDNTAVSYLYEPVHPGVLRTIKFVVDSAHKAGIRVGMCGEMAADPNFVLLLIGLGLDELSMNPASIPLVKKLVRAIDHKEAERIASRALELPTAQDVEEHVLETLISRFPHGFA